MITACRRLKYLVRNSSPLISSSIFSVLMNLGDTLTIAKISNKALTAQSFASLIFLTLFLAVVAFIFPIANLVKMDWHNQISYLKKGLQCCWILGLMLVVIIWFITPSLSYFLPPQAQESFVSYLRYSSFRLLPGITFIFLRMVLYTENEPKQITMIMFQGLFLNILGNICIYSCWSESILQLKLIGLFTSVIFIWLSFKINHLLPSDKKILAIISAQSGIYFTYLILKNCTPSMLTALLEYIFFCVIGIIILEKIPHELASYRILIQVEELLILILYAISLVISLEISKSINNKDHSYFLTDNVIYVVITMVVATLIVFLYPFLLTLLQLESHLDLSTLILIYCLLTSESIMLLTLGWLRGIANNATILVITSCTNWLIITPLLLFTTPNKLEYYLKILIFNYIIIAVGATLVFKSKKALIK